MSDIDWAVRTTAAGEFVERVRRPALAVQLGLEPHPEGGWYARTWTSPDSLEITDADGGVRRRPAATLIVFYLPVGEASAWHRVASTEFWIWNGRGPVALELGGSGASPVPASSVLLDADHPQAEVPAGHWQRTLVGSQEALVSCMVSPGFDFADFALEQP